MASKSAKPATILAAGCVVTRGFGRTREYLVVHRNLRDDWSLPKGKLEADELMPTAAARETLEEAAVDVILRQPVTTIRYLSLGVPKLVRYWLATPRDPLIAAGELDFDPEWEPNDEVDRIKWLRSDQLLRRLTYKQDIQVLKRALELSESTSPFVLMRHAPAEKRTDFADRHSGNAPHDHERPLTYDGSTLTPALADALRAYGVEDSHSSPAKRCVDTLVPHFAELSEVQLEPQLSEFGFVEDAAAAQHRAVELFRNSQPLVIVGHRPVLPTMVRAIERYSDCEAPSPKLKPGEFMVFHRPTKKSGALRVGAPMAVESSADFLNY